MKKITIEHVRVLKHFTGKKPTPVNKYEKFLISYVSIPTARKIIKDLVNSGSLNVSFDEKDKRKKLLTVAKDYDDYL